MFNRVGNHLFATYIIFTGSYGLCVCYIRRSRMHRFRCTIISLELIVLLFFYLRLLHVYLTLKIIFCVILIIIGILCLLSIILNARDLLLCTNYLRYAGNFFAKSIFLTILVFVFYVLTIGLIALMIFQTLAYWSHG